MSTQTGLRATTLLIVFVSLYKLIEVPFAAATISLKAVSVMFRRAFTSRRRNPLATSSVILGSIELLSFWLLYFKFWDSSKLSELSSNSSESSDPR